MISGPGSLYGESPEGGLAGGGETAGRTMDKVHDAIAWYQKKIGSYDKQLWEQSVEKKLQKSHFLHNAPRKSVRLKTEYIDVDLIRGSTFAKTKPQVPWVYITRRAVARIIFYPFYYTWWVHQTSVQMYFLLLVLYVMQVATMVVYVRNFDHTILEDEMSFTEVILPALLMLLLCIIHSQTVLAHITHKPPKRSKDLSRVVRKPKLRKPSRRGQRSSGASGNNSSACPDDSGADQRGRLDPGRLDATPKTRNNSPLPASSQTSVPSPLVPSPLDSQLDLEESLTDRISLPMTQQTFASQENFTHQVSTTSTLALDDSESSNLHRSTDTVVAGAECCVNDKDKVEDLSSWSTSVSDRYESKGGKSKGVSSEHSIQHYSSCDSLHNGSQVQGGNVCQVDSGRSKTALSVSQEGRRKECEDSGCDAISDSLDTPADSKKLQCAFSVDSFSGHSDFEIVEQHCSACNKRDIQTKVDCVSTDGTDDSCRGSQASQQYDTKSPVSESGADDSLSLSPTDGAQALHKSLSQVHQDSSVSSSKVWDTDLCSDSKTSVSCSHSQTDPQIVPKIVIQQASSGAHHPSDSSSSSAISPNSADTTTSVPSLTADSTKKAEGTVSSLDSSDSAHLQHFSEMFVQKFLEEEIEHPVSGSTVSEVCEPTNSSSVSNLSTYSDIHPQFGHCSTDTEKDALPNQQPSLSVSLPSSLPAFPVPLDESLEHPSDGERPSDVSNYNPSDSESDDLQNDLRGRCEDRGKRLRFHETVVSGPTASKLSSKPPSGPSHSILTRKTPPLNSHSRKSSGNIIIVQSSGSDQDPTDCRSSLRRRKRTSSATEATEIKPISRSRPSSLGLRAQGVKGKHQSSSENETGGAIETPEGSTKAALSSEEWEDRIQSDETTSSAYTSSCGEGESEGEEDKSEYTTSTLHVINLLHPQTGTPNSSGSVSQPDKVSCVIWEGNECKKVDLTALDIGWAIIDKVDSLPESSDYFLIGLLFSLIMALMPLIYRGFGSKNEMNWDELMSLPELGMKLLSLSENYSWRQHVVMINGIIQRLVLSLVFFFLLSVADRTFKQRLLYAKHFSYLTSSRRARKFSMPHFRLNKVRNIKIWLSLRSYLKRRGPQRSVDVIVSACFMCAVCVVCLISIQMLKETETYLDYLCNWELMVWCLALGVFLMRFMTLGLKINKKYRNLSVLITEQINLYLQMEQKPHKKDELILANNVLRLAEDLLKELESPFKISGFSANPLIYNIMRVVVLSAFSAVLTEVLGFKLKLYKIKLKG